MRHLAGGSWLGNAFAVPPLNSPFGSMFSWKVQYSGPIRILLPVDEVLERIREHTDEASLTALFRGKRLFLSRVRKTEFWIQARLRKCVEPRMTGAISEDGFTTLVFVNIQRRPITHFLLWSSAFSGPLVLWCALLAGQVDLRLALVMLSLGFLQLVILGLVMALSVRISARFSGQSDDAEVQFFRELFTDELLDWENAA